MTIVIFVVVVVLVGLWVVSKSVNSISKSTQKMQNRSRCEQCGSRLKAVSGRYAGTCRHCGARQSWA